MAKFKIKIGKREEFEKEFDIKNYPKLEPSGAPLYVRIGYGTYLELNDIVVLDNIKHVWGWAYDIADQCFEAIESLVKEGKEYMLSFTDVSFDLEFKPIDKKEVLITFNWGEDTTYLPELEDKREQLKDVPVPFDECIDKLYNAGNEYIETILDINPRLAESDELKHLIKERDIVKKLIIDYKQQNQQI